MYLRFSVMTLLSSQKYIIRVSLASLSFSLIWGSEGRLLENHWSLVHLAVFFPSTTVGRSGLRKYSNFVLSVSSETFTSA